MVAREVDLLRDTNVLAFDHADGLTSVVLEDKERTVSGQLMLVFDEERGILQQWIIIDGKGRKTTVTLSDLQPNVKVDPKLFVVKINRKAKGKD